MTILDVSSIELYHNPILRISKCYKCYLNDSPCTKITYRLTSCTWIAWWGCAVLWTLCPCYILVFEPGDEGKNEVEYKKIYDDYKNLVRIYYIAKINMNINS